MAPRKETDISYYCEDCDNVEQTDECNACGGECSTYCSICNKNLDNCDCETTEN